MFALFTITGPETLQTNPCKDNGVVPSDGRVWQNVIKVAFLAMVKIAEIKEHERFITLQLHRVYHLRFCSMLMFLEVVEWIPERIAFEGAHPFF